MVVGTSRTPHLSSRDRSPAPYLNAPKRAGSGDERLIGLRVRGSHRTVNLKMNKNTFFVCFAYVGIT